MERPKINEYKPDEINCGDDMAQWYMKFAEEQEKYIDLLENKLSKQEPNEWVSCKDRLPEKYMDFESSKKVLVYDSKEGTYKTAYNHLQGFWETHTGVHGITHWMPLPAKPNN